MGKFHTKQYDKIIGELEKLKLPYTLFGVPIISDPTIPENQFRVANAPLSKSEKAHISSYNRGIEACINHLGRKRNEE